MREFYSGQNVHGISKFENLIFLFLNVSILAWNTPAQNEILTFSHSVTYYRKIDTIYFEKSQVSKMKDILK